MRISLQDEYVLQGREDNLCSVWVSHDKELNLYVVSGLYRNGKDFSYKWIYVSERRKDAKNFIASIL